VNGRKNKRKAVTMRKLMYSLGAVLIAIAVIFIWSRTALAPSMATTASMIGFPQRAVVAPEATPMSPHEMTINYKAPLRAEQWDAF
jgi:hypothetical protein